MINEKDSVWARLLRYKYYKDGVDLQNISARCNASTTWKGIVENVDLLKKGMGHAVADGCTTLFWKHI